MVMLYDLSKTGAIEEINKDLAKEEKDKLKDQKKEKQMEIAR